MIYIKKYKDEETETEYIKSTDIFKIKGYSEFDKKGQDAYFFIESIVRPMIEYYNTYSSTAFGNPDLARMEGKFIGFCMGKGWDIDEYKDKIIIRSAKGRKLYCIEKPCTPKDEIEKRKDIAQMWDNFFG